MKKYLPYLTMLTTILCAANLIYLCGVQAQINEVRKDIQFVRHSVSEMTKVPSINDEFSMEDPLNPSPNNLQDILDRIDELEKNISFELGYRNRYR